MKNPIHPNKIEFSTKERNEDVVKHFLSLIHTHLEDLMDGRSDKMMELTDIATILCIAPKQLIRIFKEIKKNHPCHFYVEEIIRKSKKLLEQNQYTISDIAILLTYDPSNFTKFFKKHTGLTPTEYRKSLIVKSSPLS